jgi:hypothetical protein
VEVRGDDREDEEDDEDEDKIEDEDDGRLFAGGREERGEWKVSHGRAVRHTCIVEK